MDSPRAPKPALKKTITKVSVRTVTSHPLEDGNPDGEPAGRSKFRAFKLKTKFGGRDHAIELVPQPSDDPRDPLNWPKWRKETTFLTLLLSTAVVSILKTLFVTTNAVIATEYNVSYMMAAALTGIPFIFAAFSGLCASVLGKVVGKRALMVGGGVLMLVGAVWNMHVMGSYGQFMGSRVFQGVGWGVFEGLVGECVGEVFFAHERTLRMNVLRTTEILFTWGSPILGGYLSQNSAEFMTEIMVANLIQAVSVFFLIFFLPETTLSPSDSSSPTSSPSSLRNYLVSLKPISYIQRGGIREGLRTIRALVAPSTILTFLLTAPVIASAYGVANSMSLIFAAMPTFLFPSHLGFLFTGPLLLSLLGFSLTAFFSRKHSPSNITNPTSSLFGMGSGIVVGVTGLLAFGLYTNMELTPEILDETNTVFALTTPGAGLSLDVVSLLFGLLIAGSSILSSSAPAASSSHNAGNDLQRAQKVYENLLIGVFVTAMPTWIASGMQAGMGGMMTGLKSTVIALGVLSLVVGSTVGAGLWVVGERVGNVDARVLGGRDEMREWGGVGGSTKLRKWDDEGSFLEG